jgi:hypothetical protein
VCMSRHTICSQIRSMKNWCLCIVCKNTKFGVKNGFVRDIFVVYFTEAIKNIGFLRNLTCTHRILRRKREIFCSEFFNISKYYFPMAKAYAPMCRIKFPQVPRRTMCSSSAFLLASRIHFSKRYVPSGLPQQPEKLDMCYVSQYTVR